MMWTAIILTAIGAYLFKLAGLSIPGAVLEHPLVHRVADLMPVALLAALVAVQVFSDGPSLTIDARAAGLGMAVVALLLRAPFILVVLVAALTAGIIRLI